MYLRDGSAQTILRAATLEIEVADPTFYLTQSQYTDTGPTSPSADPVTPGAWQGSRWSANFEVTGMTRPLKKSRRKRDSNPGPSALEADALTTRPTRRSHTHRLCCLCTVTSTQQTPVGDENKNNKQQLTASQPNNRSQPVPHDAPNLALTIRVQMIVCLFVGCLSSQQQASVSQGRICTDNFTCCHTEIEAADQTFHLTRSQYTDTGPTSPSADPVTPGAWQGSHWSANFEVTGMTRPRKNAGASGIRTRDLPLSRRTP